MSSRSSRKSRPAFSEWRPRCSENESTICVTSVAESEFVLAGEPSCWKPSIVKVGSAFSKAAFVGIPGRPRACGGRAVQEEARAADRAARVAQAQVVDDVRAERRGRSSATADWARVSVRPDRARGEGAAAVGQRRHGIRQVAEVAEAARRAGRCAEARWSRRTSNWSWSSLLVPDAPVVVGGARAGSAADSGRGASAATGSMRSRGIVLPGKGSRVDPPPVAGRVVAGS